MKKLLIMLSSFGLISAAGAPIQACGTNEEPVVSSTDAGQTDQPVDVETDQPVDTGQTDQPAATSKEEPNVQLTALETAVAELTAGPNDIRNAGIVSVDGGGEPYVSTYSPGDDVVGVDDLFRPWFKSEHANEFSIDDVKWTGFQVTSVEGEAANIHSVIAAEVTVKEESSSKTLVAENVTIIFATAVIQ